MVLELTFLYICMSINQLHLMILYQEYSEKTYLFLILLLMKIIKDTLSLIKLFYFKYVIISGNIFHNQINSLHFNRNFKIVERNLLYKYFDR